MGMRDSIQGALSQFTRNRFKKLLASVAKRNFRLQKERGLDPGADTGRPHLQTLQARHLGCACGLSGQLKRHPGVPEHQKHQPTAAKNTSSRLWIFQSFHFLQVQHME